MIIWSGLGILIPLVAIVGLVAGTVLGTALGFPVAGIGLGFLLAATGNWGLWKLVYPETPKVLIDPATGQQVVINPKHGLFFIPARAWTWILGFFAIPAVLLGVIGEKAAADQREQHDRANEGCGGHGQRGAAVVQRPVDDAAVALRLPVEPAVEPVQRPRDGVAALVGLDLRIGPVRREHGVQRKADEQ